MAHDQLKDPREKPRDLSFLTERYEEARSARRPFEADWWLNLAYISGEQALTYVPENGTLIAREDYKDITVHNAIMPIVRTERAKIHKTGVFPKVLPSKDTDDAHSAAKISEAYLQAELRRWVFPKKFREGSFWIVACGNVFYHWYWDGKNHASVEVIPPFEVYPDPFAKSFGDERWVIRERFMSEEEAWDLYAGKKGAELRHLRPTETPRWSPSEHRVYCEALGFSAVNLGGVTVREYYQPPTERNPKGEFIAFTESGIVYAADKYPYAHGRVPLTHAGHIERTSSKWCASIVDFLRGPQDALNRREHLIEENLNVSASGKWFLGHGLELNEDPDAQPRQILRATGAAAIAGVKPEWIQPTPLPAWVVNEVDRVGAYMRDMAGQHEISQGSVPGRVESGQAIQLLQEQDDSVMKDTIHSLEEALVTGMRLTLSNAKQFGSADTFLRVYDQFGTVEVMEFKRSQIDLDAQVDVKITTSLPTTIAGRFDRVMNLVQYEIVTPTEARRLLELASEDPDLDPDIVSRRRQHEEILHMIQSGEFILPEAYQNHGAEIDELKKWLNSEAALKVDPDRIDMLKAHLQVHEQLELIEAEKAGQLARVAQGEPIAAVMAPPGDPAAGGAPPAEPPPPDGQGPPEVLNPGTS